MFCKNSLENRLKEKWSIKMGDAAISAQSDKHTRHNINFDLYLICIQFDLLDHKSSYKRIEYSSGREKEERKKSRDFLNGPGNAPSLSLRSCLRRVVALTWPTLSKMKTIFVQFVLVQVVSAALYCCVNFIKKQNKTQSNALSRDQPV